MCILPAQQAAASAARLLSAQARQQLALSALAGVPIAQLAAENQVSRKFVYQQLDKAHQGVQLAFEQPQPPEDLRFWLPVTRSWLQQLVLGLVLVCHSSFRGVGELLADVFDYPVSAGSVHNILAGVVAKAEPLNSQQDLSAIRIGALDE